MLYEKTPDKGQASDSSSVEYYQKFSVKWFPCKSICHENAVSSSIVGRKTSTLRWSSCHGRLVIQNDAHLFSISISNSSLKGNDSSIRMEDIAKACHECKRGLDRIWQRDKWKIRIDCLVGFERYVNVLQFSNYVRTTSWDCERAIVGNTGCKIRDVRDGWVNCISPCKQKFSRKVHYQCHF